MRAPFQRLRNKPQYVFHPLRAVRRALNGASAGRSDTGGEIAVAELPWGLPLKVYSDEQIGFSILTAGVFDPCVSETMYRLIEPGDLVVDVGANVGYLTSIAALRAGPAGAVVACEPHPRVFGLLADNVSGWSERADLAAVELHQVALSDHGGTGELSSGPLFGANMGLATLLSQGAQVASEEDLVSVEVTRLDELIGERPIGLLKIDVEGHEPAVLRGALGLLERGAVRDVIFEDHDPYPDDATELVEGAGYRLFSLDNGLRRLFLGAPQDRGAVEAWPGPSYLATRDPERALARLKPRGWQLPGISFSLRELLRRS